MTHWRLSLVFLFLAGTVNAFAAAPVVPALDARNWDVGNMTAIAYDPAVKKLYLGTHTYDQQRRNLVVFDVDARGAVVGHPRRYVVTPEAGPAGSNRRVDAMLLDAPRRKLYLGLSASGQDILKPLAVFALDAKGEPIGAPQVFDNGSPYHRAAALVMHPTLRRLYTAGWGGEHVYAIDLDDRGLPAGAPVVIPAGGNGKYSLGIRPDGTKLYLGTAPGLLQVIDLDGRGNRTGAVREYRLPGAPDRYLVMMANAKGVYFRTPDGGLGRWALDAKGEPVGEPVIDASRKIDALALTDGGNLVVSEPVAFADALTGESRTSGVRVRGYLLNADGSVGAQAWDTPVHDRFATAQLSAAPAAAIALTAIPGVIGNRVAGLSLRATVQDLSVAGTLPAAFTAVKPGKLEGAYVKFAYAPRRNAVYGADGSSLYLLSLADPGALRTVPCADSTQVVAVDETLGLLYVAKPKGVLEIRRLQADGLPEETGETIQTGMQIIESICINPLTHHAYLCGYVGTAGQVPGARSENARRLIQVPSHYYTNAVAVDAVRGRLYIGTSCDDNHNNLQVWKLKTAPAPDAGTLLEATPTRYPDRLPESTPPQRSCLNALRLDAGRRRLYLGGNPERVNGKGWLVVQALDDRGDPVGVPAVTPSKNAAGAVNALELSPDGTWLYESGWGDNKVVTWPLDARGRLIDRPRVWALGNNGKVGGLCLTADRALLLAGSYPDLELIAMKPDGTAIGAPAATFTLGEISASLGALRPGTPSAWVGLDRGLKDGRGTTYGRLALTGGVIGRATVRFDLSRDGGKTVLVSRVCRVDGGVAALYLPYYDIDAAGLAAFPDLLQTGEMRANQYLGYAARGAQPRQFIIAIDTRLGDCNTETLRVNLETLAMMGHNTVGPGVPDVYSGTRVQAARQAAGLTRLKHAIYNPPAYFDYRTESFAPGVQDGWAAGFKKDIAAMGGTPGELALFHMADEPGWYFPACLNDLNDPAHPERVRVFRDYLRGKGFTPAFFGAAGWEALAPIGQSKATTLEQRRLFYWTTRFYAESLSNSFAVSTAALRKALNPRLLTTSNLNNWPGRFYVPSPGEKYLNNSDTGPDAAQGAPDWFDLGRKKGVSAMWTEDWFPDQSAGQWSFYSDLLRCAAREGGVEFGAYVIGTIGTVPDGAKYKMLSLIGHGAKAIDTYTFGPTAIFGDGWSDHPQVYKPYADAIALVAKGEKLLYPGRPRTGTVAILLPISSQPWDGAAPLKMYMREIYGLYDALIHAQYPVDILDETDIAGGKLAANGYAALYVTSPNLPANVQETIAAWVKAGGTLALFPGAARADEYNEPATVLVPLQGAAWGTVPRVEAVHWNFDNLPRYPVAVLDRARVGAAADRYLIQAAGLALAGATSLASFPDGSSALAEMKQGNGRVFSYGYWPGYTYEVEVDRFDRTRLPRDWRAETRAIITLPARSAGAKKFVDISEPLVEGAVLDSAAGIAVTLLNWTGDPLRALAVSLNLDQVPASVRAKLAAARATGKLKVESAEAGRLAYAVNGGRLTVTLPLKTVDVLMIGW